MMPVRLPIAGIFCAILCAHATTANAALKLCNRTSYVLYAATAYSAGGDGVTQGWTRIVPGACQEAIKEALTAPAYYVYARSSFGHAGASRAWGGTSPFCVKDANFTLRAPGGASRCSAADTFDRPFAALQTHRKSSWTMTFDEAPPFNSLKDAETAGLKRLLRDQGTRIGAIDAKPDKLADAALAAFRKRLNMASTASASDLFDALETEALKTTAPTGYSVCNDSAKPIAVAIGQQLGAKWVSRGWWAVAAGGCAKALPDPIAVDKIYLRAERPDGASVVSGAAKFCITNIEFEIEGREHCAQRGLNEAGFAETATKGMSGFAAHIGEHGLLASPHAAMPK